MKRVHHPVEPFPVFVRREFLYDGDSTYLGQTERGRLVSVSSYPGHELTFTVLLSDTGALFHYLPVTALRAEPFGACAAPTGYGVASDIRTRSYHGCPEAEFVITNFAEAGHMNWGWALLADGWMECRYLFSVDWYTGNDLLHLISLTDGTLAAWPSHKILFQRTRPTMLPGYRKMHATWESPLGAESFVPTGAARFAVAALMRSPNGDILTIARRENAEDLGLPGGKVDIGETLEAALAREVREETGAEVLEMHPVFAGVDGKFIVVTFAVTRWQGAPKDMPGEGRVAWHKPSTLMQPVCSFANYNAALLKTLGIVLAEDRA